MELLARTCKSERMNIERLVARALVVAGGVFWALAAFGASTRYLEEGADAVMTQAWILLGITVVVLAIGWFYENLVAVILFALTAGFIVWGFITPTFEGGVWAIWMLFTAAPTALAGVLFLLAARMQKICNLEEAKPAG